jgi:LPS-assembly protein
MMALQCVVSQAAHAEEKLDELLVKAKDATSWRLRADEFTYDWLQEVYTARGGVSLESKDGIIRAEEIRLDAITRQAILEGGVRIELGANWLEGKRAFFDLEEQTGTVEDGKGFLADNHFYFSGSLIEKTGPETYFVKKGRFTTCDGEKPSWHFRARELDIDAESYGRAKHAKFYVGSAPVLYTPYARFPTKRERKSGFLPPRLADSTLRGLDIDLPFFWAISESMDTTFYAHYMSKRGFMGGAEFRYAASEESKGILRFDYLKDQADDRFLRQQGLRQVEPGFDGDYSNRWWWRSKQDFVLPHQIWGALDVDVVSDRDYLREFETGFSGWDESNEVFENTFDRSLINDFSVTTRESFLVLNKNWSAYSANADVHYFYNLNTKEDGRTLQQLPLLNFNGSRQPFFGGPLFFQGKATYINYWRRQETHGHRLDLHPRLGWPLSIGPYLELEPSAGVRETIYLVDEYDEPEDSRVRNKTFQSRGLFDARVDLASEIMHVYPMDRGTWTRTKHTIRPEIIYEYIPEVSQSKYPLFDAVDRIPSQNSITYSITNFFIARIDKGPEEADYRRIGRLKFSQTYNITRPDGGLDIETSLNERRRFSNITTDLDVTPLRYFNLTYQNEWSVYDGDFKRHEVRFRSWDKRGDRLGIDYRLIRDMDGRDVISEIDGDILVNLWAGLSAYFRSNYSLEQKRNIKTELRVNFKRQCWGISCSFVNKPDDNKVMMGINLLGIGEVLPGDTELVGN